VVSEELEQFWQDAATAGDVLAIECKEIAATVDGPPIAPVVTMLRKVHEDLLRLSKFLLATASARRRRSTPFRGTVQTTRRPTCYSCAELALGSALRAKYTTW